MCIIDRINRLLRERGISAAKMMRDLNFSSGLYSQWKSMGRIPSTDKIEVIAAYLGVSTDYLISGEEGDGVPTSSLTNNHEASMIITDKNERLLIQHYRALHYARQIQILSSLITEVENNQNS
jgi:transcriptional regulator with XRE-family HTH domain